ncbi:Down syndrome critical region homolog 6 (human) (predicted), isoform CRA_a [Rattus norvegicus]|uniref:Down syndrome critical region homolog 6 (Human) (Predicted), isoform CRA_a n=1 Tax=Rattus norvegicus TaxID=10116 RepID=A6KPX9_RAT|nr:Down syndrome critical region homolog 6 (human) (predicted), isoform CRA_a [Rattus norvegicus]
MLVTVSQGQPSLPGFFSSLLCGKFRGWTVLSTCSGHELNFYFLDVCMCVCVCLCLCICLCVCTHVLMHTFEEGCLMRCSQEEGLWSSLPL